MNTICDFLSELAELVRIGCSAEGRDFVALAAIGGFISTIIVWSPTIAEAMK